MEPVELALSQVRQFAREAVNERGEDFTYSYADDWDGLESCFYFYEGEPSCIVGHVLARAGVRISECDGVNQGSVDQLVGDWILVDPVTQDYLCILQIAQDSGVPWGECLAEAESKLREKYPELFSIQGEADEQHRVHAA